MQLSLIKFSKIKVILLSNSPCLTYKLLKEFSSKKEVMRFYLYGW